MSNFQFLQSDWPEIYEAAGRTEKFALPDPRASAFYARRTLELAVKWLYAHDDTLTEPYDDTLSALLHEPSFRALVPQTVWFKMRVLKDLGNEAVHSHRKIAERDGYIATQELFHVLYWLGRTYSKTPLETTLTFEPAFLTVEDTQKALTTTQLQELQQQLADRDKALKAKEEAHAKTAADYDAQIAVLKAEIAAVKKANSATPDNHDYSEAQTRDYFIDLLLREAGWPLDQKRDREFEVEGMPNNQGKGYVDYVLWGDDGLPLAVVEAKRTRKDARVGKRQAELYADCLETKFGRRPLIFFTNGYEHWFWDDTHYPSRPVQGFYTKDELELILQRRGTQKKLSSEKIDSKIVGRYYQNEAIRTVCDHFEQDKQRKALVVMATGAGKTRTVIALADILTRANWAKRVLFLADRVALVNQAANAFKTHLPDLPRVNLVKEKEDNTSRVFFSTYPTMMGLIDEAKKDGSRRFGAGFFDLIVIDEAHRSVYQKFGAIFEYFDSLLVGLTATPKDEVDKNTYKLFELQSGVPTYDYGLERAVGDGFLVPPKAIDVPLKFQREGIKYDELSEEEKEDWDALDWSETGDVPEKVDAAAINKWLFNEDTVDKVLEHLMKSGLKVDGGDRLGKTIIFAKNHQHALYIEERFNKNYPKLAGKFARVIDNYESYAQSLLDDFSTPDKMPHIAISVDMLDTGIDVPEVVNLVFFKQIRSKTKFWQMIGRGTRLCPNLFGPGKDKTNFLCFDYCGNFEFFGSNPDGVETGAQASLSEKLFKKRLELLQNLRDKQPQAGIVVETANAYGTLDVELADHLHAEVAAMNTTNFIVRPKRGIVERFAERAAWDELPADAAQEVAENLAGLPTELDPEDITARQFDLLMLGLQLSALKPTKASLKQQKQVREIAGLLEEKAAVPAVAQQLELIQEIQTDEFWQGVTVILLENVRKKLRDLVKFIDRASRNVVYTDFEDELGIAVEVDLPEIAAGVDAVAYKKKVEQYIKEHLDHPVVSKIRENLPIDSADIKMLEKTLRDIGGDAGDKLYPSVFGAQPNLGSFLRRLVGLDREAAKKAFGQFLMGSTYTSSQIAFVNQIIDYLTANGVMDPGLLYEQPFTNFSPMGLDGVFKGKDAELIVGILSGINANANVGTYA